jgi:hypothetical protein
VARWTQRGSEKPALLEQVTHAIVSTAIGPTSGLGLIEECLPKCVMSDDADDLLGWRTHA